MSANSNLKLKTSTQWGTWTGTCNVNLFCFSCSLTKNSTVILQIGLLSVCQTECGKNRAMQKEWHLSTSSLSIVVNHLNMLVSSTTMYFCCIDLLISNFCWTDLDASNLHNRNDDIAAEVYKGSSSHLLNKLYELFSLNWESGPVAKGSKTLLLYIFTSTKVTNMNVTTIEVSPFCALLGRSMEGLS